MIHHTGHPPVGCCPPTIRRPIRTTRVGKEISSGSAKYTVIWPPVNAQVG